jgi:hypothetical protein
MIEFALVAPTYFLVIFVAFTAMFYSIEQEAMTGAAAVAVRIAAGSTQSADLSGLGDNSQALRDATASAIQHAQPAMVGVRLREYIGSCADYRATGPGDVVVCSYNEPNGTVTVRFHGRVGILVGQSLGFKQGADIDVHATVHRETFSR